MERNGHKRSVYRCFTNVLKSVEDEGYVSLKEIPGTDIELENIYKNRTLDILHFIGHGSFNKITQEGELILEDRHGNAKTISAQKFSSSLPKSIKLIFLNACESARGNSHEPFSSIAYLLAKQGHVVIAMQFQISTNAAVRFADSFYAEIAKGTPVDEAVAEARQRVFTMVDCNPLDWAAPTLYLKSENGVLFNIKAPSPRHSMQEEEEAELGTEVPGADPLESSPSAPLPSVESLDPEPNQLLVQGRRYLRSITTRLKESPLWVKIVSVAVILVIVTGSTIATVVGSNTRLGGLDLVGGYCPSLHYQNAIHDPRTTLDWVCTRQPSLMINMTQACNWQYPNSHSTARNTAANSPGGNWLCYKNQTELGGLDLNGYCLSQYYDKADPAGNFDWICTRFSSLKIDMTQACQWQYHGLFVRSRNTDNDPYQWYCVGLVL